MSLSEAKNDLSGLVDEVESTRQTITITRADQPVAVLISADDLESMEETLYWCAVPGAVEEAAGIREEFATGKAINLDDVRSEWGLPDSWFTSPPSTIA